MSRTGLVLFPFLVVGRRRKKLAFFRNAGASLCREDIGVCFTEHGVIHWIGKVGRLIILEDTFVDNFVVVDVLVVSHVDRVRDFHVGAVCVRLHSLVFEEAGRTAASVDQHSEDQEHYQEYDEHTDEDDHQRGSR